MDGLSAAEARDFVVSRGLVDPAREVTVTRLGGGVSNDTLLASDGVSRMVVKRALAQLRTEREWHASPRRALDEAVALGIAATLTPEAVPEVLAVDERAATVAMAAAPEGWEDWKVRLLRGDVDPRVGSRLGTVLAAWHAQTHGVSQVLDLLPDLDRMLSLRIRPFHDVIAQRHRDLEARIRSAQDQLTGRRLCLVHGDFSPKNVMVGNDGVWVIDFEVAHVGNPIFDVAFLQAHLLLKALGRPSLAAELADTFTAFCESYGAPVIEIGEELGLHTGCLVLARVDGTSPVDYLTDEDRAVARGLGRGLAAGTLSTQAAWERVQRG